MALFKHKNNGVCEVLTNENIAKLRKDSNYKEIKDSVKESKETKKEEILNKEQVNSEKK